MKQIATLLFAFALFVPFYVQPLVLVASDKSLRASEAKSHVGERSTVCGRVSSTQYGVSSDSSRKFVKINLNKPHPYEVFNIVIEAADLPKFDSSAWGDGKLVCASGTISSHQGVPEMVVGSPDQITELDFVVDNEPQTAESTRTPVRLSEIQIVIFHQHAEFFVRMAPLYKNEITRQIRFQQAGLASFSTLKLTMSGQLDSLRQWLSDVQTEFFATQPNEPQQSAGSIFFEYIFRRLDRMSVRVQALMPSSAEVVQNEYLSTIESISLAYQSVAENGLTFDLVVESVPQDAVVSYKREGDNYTTDPNPTNTTLQNLVFAPVTVRVQKKGYADQEKTHDPFRERNHVIYFALDKSR